MQWDTDHLVHPERWWVDDPRWLASLDADELETLFGDRPWIEFGDKPWAEGPWDVKSGIPGDGLVTADLVYYENEPGTWWPPEAYLAAATHIPGEIGGRPLRTVRVPAGTSVHISRHATWSTVRPEDVDVCPFELPDGQRLFSFPASRRGTSMLRNVLVTALVVPLGSPFANTESGATLIRRARDLSSAEFTRLFGATALHPDHGDDAAPPDD
jgi:hypothetical protein